jgi:hypothetical protein
MNCTEDEFRDKVRAFSPNKKIWGITEANGRFVLAHDCDYNVFHSYDLKAQCSASDFVWYAGSVIKDTDGLFASPPGQFFTPSGSYTITLPISGKYHFSVVGRGSGGAGGSGSGKYDFSVVVGGGGGGAGSGKSPAKCECGAHSVGSNRHSSYCPLDKENS